jgi:hypothetical protein
MPGCGGTIGAKSGAARNLAALACTLAQNARANQVKSAAGPLPAATTG